MKATITSTSAVVDMKDPKGREYTCRVWEGVTEAGVPFTAYVGTVQVARNADNSVFERELQEHTTVRPDTQRAIDMRFVI